MTPCVFWCFFFLLFPTHWDVTVTVSCRDGCFIGRKQRGGERGWNVLLSGGRVHGQAGPCVGASPRTLMLSTLTEEGDIAPRNWILPNCHFPLEKKDLEAVVKKLSENIPETCGWPVQNLSRVSRVPSSRWTSFASFLAMYTPCSSSNSGRMGRDWWLCLALRPSPPFFFPEPNTRHVCMCVLYLPSQHILMTLYSTACLSYLGP